MQLPLPRAIAAIAAATTLAGCVERKMVIRSDPPGAMIALDGEDTRLRTPAEVPFDFGGLREVTLTAPGYRVLDSTAELSDPWFTYFPLDVVGEFLWPGTIEDVQAFDYRLSPYAQGSPNEAERTRLARKLAEIKLRAEEYRAGGSEGPGRVVPPPAK